MKIAAQILSIFLLVLNVTSILFLNPAIVEQTDDRVVFVWSDVHPTSKSQVQHGRYTVVYYRFHVSNVFMWDGFIQKQFKVIYRVIKQ